MRNAVGVLDVGCFSAHLVVVDADRGSPTDALLSRKVRLRLDRAYDGKGCLRREGIEQVAGAVATVRRYARKAGLPLADIVPFATSSVRDAVNADEIVRQVARRTGVTLRRFSGRQEARLAYLAARRWYGRAAGALTVLDVGGGTVEVAVGESDTPSVARSLPYGARTLTRLGLAVGHEDEVEELIRDALAPDDLVALHAGHAVGCSKVFQGLARLADTSSLQVEDLDRWIPRLARLSARRRAKLPGISRHRAEQSLAGAVAARALMVATGHDRVEISPWSTKEGLLLTLMDRKPTPIASVA
ncbi:exopolyphosphatase [Actinokineospora auranticolor]|uniref:Exopolyphosphatase/guanosine-5'-triphosphate, 3'-diphosphate pyrophosphatase n=1 Tax=Actinokineospora auranticolor TaxID=155976 RepID=A0A2S6GEE1_9PSEU|nr:exopolyphosphatase [Actinokineospora auranticolor]PPK63609.1 exopolyphosphatase/guanosine-5'-triphosphate,3'-diphosphate pyrophosphatase [Actinokineospora auranticolor]